MIETLLQAFILLLPIYALLTVLIITHHPQREESTVVALPHHRWGKPQPKNKPKRRKQHVRRQENGELKIEEEEKRPRGKPKGAKGGARHTPPKKWTEPEKPAQTSAPGAEPVSRRSRNPAKPKRESSSTSRKGREDP